MKKIVMVLFLLLCVPVSSFADVTCIGVPQAVKVGEYGAQELYLIVTLNGMDYRLGTADDPWAKARLALVTSAFISTKTLVLKFWLSLDCNAASLNHDIPNSVRLTD